MRIKNTYEEQTLTECLTVMMAACMHTIHKANTEKDAAAANENHTI